MGTFYLIIFLILIIIINIYICIFVIINKVIINLLLYSFHQNQNIIVLGATNRREDLDRALLRPGRFDIEVEVCCK